MGKWIQTQICLVLKLTFFSMHWTVSRMFSGRQTDGCKSEEVWINTSYRTTEIPSWKPWLGWSNKYQKNILKNFFLGGIARWNSMCLTSIYQTWIYFLIAKEFHVTARIRKLYRNHQLHSQTELTTVNVFLISLSFSSNIYIYIVFI